MARLMTSEELFALALEGKAEKVETMLIEEWDDLGFPVSKPCLVITYADEILN